MGCEDADEGDAREGIVGEGCAGLEMAIWTPSLGIGVLILRVGAGRCWWRMSTRAEPMCFLFFSGFV